jgi:uncharacterized protein (DUF2342 family)
MPLKSSLASRHVKLKQPIHPVVQTALDKLKGGGGGRAYGLLPADVDVVREQVQALETPEELRAAMKGLLELGFFLATCQASPTAGHALAEIARTIARTLTPHPAPIVAPVPAKRVAGPNAPRRRRARN